MNIGRKFNFNKIKVICAARVLRVKTRNGYSDLHNTKNQGPNRLAHMKYTHLCVHRIKRRTVCVCV